MSDEPAMHDEALNEGSFIRRGAYLRLGTRFQAEETSIMQGLRIGTTYHQYTDRLPTYSAIHV